MLINKARSGCEHCFPISFFPTTKFQSFITRPLVASGQTNPMQVATVNSSPQMNSCNTAVCPKNWDHWTMLGTKPVNSPRLANAHEGAIAHHICKKASYKALIMVTSCNWIQGADFDPRKDRIKILGLQPNVMPGRFSSSQKTNMCKTYNRRNSSD